MPEAIDPRFHDASLRNIGRRGVTYSDSVLVTETGVEVLTDGIPLEPIIR